MLRHRIRDLLSFKLGCAQRESQLHDSSQEGPIAWNDLGSGGWGVFYLLEAAITQGTRENRGLEMQP